MLTQTVQTNHSETLLYSVGVSHYFLCDVVLTTLLETNSLPQSLRF